MELPQSKQRLEDDSDYTVIVWNIVSHGLAYSPLFGHHGSFLEYTQTAKMSSYGLSCDQIADVLERYPITIRYPISSSMI